MRAVILAGGAGMRLRPHTALVPKPLLRLGGDRPILDVMLGRLAAAGVSHVTLAVNHLAEHIMEFCGGGERWGVRVDYAVELEALGTAGPLTLVPDLPDDFLVLNGDVLSDLDVRALFAAHRASGNALTLAVCERTSALEYGVVHYDAGLRLTELDEKPRFVHHINMGIYALARALVAELPVGSPCGFDAFVQRGIAAGAQIGVFPFDGFWLDVGTRAAFDHANEHWPAIEARLA